MTLRYLDQRVKLHMLRAADAIATQGRVLRASAALGTSQPALTKSLREMEDIVGATLFDRHSRGMRLTDTGERVLRAGRAILAELVRLDEDLDLGSTRATGTVAVGALPVTAAGLLPGVLLRLQTTHPTLKVRVHGLRALAWGHVIPYGRFRLDMAVQLPLDTPARAPRQASSCSRRLIPAGDRYHAPRSNDVGSTPTCIQNWFAGLIRESPLPNHVQCKHDLKLPLDVHPADRASST